MTENDKPTRDIPPSTEQKFLPYLSHEVFVDPVSGKEEIVSILKQDASVDEEKYKKFLSHKCPIDLSHIESGGGGIHTYSYKPGLIGNIVTVSCICGAKADITDPSTW